jgi:hypothetical protein
MSIVVSAGDQLSHQARPSNDFDNAEIFGERFLIESGASMCAGHLYHDFVKATKGEYKEDERDYCGDNEKCP